MAAAAQATILTMTSPLDWLDDELNRLRSANLLRTLAVRSTPQRGERIVLSGQEFVNFGSNDYLGIAATLAEDATFRRTIEETIQSAGWGAGASPLITGRGVYHARLEEELAKFEGTEAALLFPTGFAANAGTIAALAGPGDVIASDALNHASLIDGCRLSGAKVLIYRHGDAAHARELLAAAKDARRKLIVTDSLFSMDGDFAPLADLAAIAREQGAMLMVDEAHATGVFGPSGRGICELLHVEDDVHVRVGTLSKALGSLGGFVAGEQRLIDWLTNRARTYFFSTAPPEALAAAGLAALEIVRNEPHRREELLARAGRFREQLRSHGWAIPEPGSQIIPLRIGSAGETMQRMRDLRNQGFFVPGIRPPSVPEGQSLLRLSLTWRHDEALLDRLSAALGNGPDRD
jgi:8-amino-7-oxononanoate synthase